jgi:hypothetical protein
MDKYVARVKTEEVQPCTVKYQITKSYDKSFQIRDCALESAPSPVNNIREHNSIE